MRDVRVGLAGLLAGATLVLASACSSDLVAPAARPASGPAASLSAAASSHADVLQRSSVLKGARHASVTVDVNGGVLEIPEAGLRVVIPYGAVSGTVTITATAIGGTNVAYQFGPHGTQFNVPLQVTQDLTNTKSAGLNVSNFFGGYYANASDLKGRVARLAEVRALTQASQSSVTFGVEHFSGYIVATGRRGGGREEMEEQ